MLMKLFLLSVFKTAVLLNIYVETDKKKKQDQQEV